MENLILLSFLAFCAIYCLSLPLNSWIYVRTTYPRKLRELAGEPGFPVNLIVPCKGAGEHLEENLRAIARQDYPRLSLRFVTDDAEDAAVPVIRKIIGETGRGVHLTAGSDGRNTCGKNLAQLVAIAADHESEVHLVCDSDMRPSPSFVLEMVRPFMDPEINVTCATRWITPSGRGLAPRIYAGLAAYSPMLMALGPINYVWGGCFSIRRRAFEEWDVAASWRGTEDDDLILCNKLNELGQRPFFVPAAVSASYESHDSIAGLVRWLTRQGQTTRLHYFPVWLALLIIESALSLGIILAAMYAVRTILTAGLTIAAAAALISIALVMLNGLLVRIPYGNRKDMALRHWLLVPLIAHAIVAFSFLLAVNPSMSWGSKILKFNKDGTIREIRVSSEAKAAREKKSPGLDRDSPQRR